MPLLLGGQVFQSAIIQVWLPVFGDIKFVTSTIFDIGVYIVVVGLVLDVLRSLGAEIDEHMEERSAAAHPDEPDGYRPGRPDLEAERDLETERELEAEGDLEPQLERGTVHAETVHAETLPAETTAKGHA
jgi:multicomponent Na+:H+ antiporter subunit A